MAPHPGRKARLPLLDCVCKLVAPALGAVEGPVGLRNGQWGRSRVRAGRQRQTISGRAGGGGKPPSPSRTFWHLTPQNQAVWHLLHLSRLCVAPQLAAGGSAGAGESREGSGRPQPGHAQCHALQLPPHASHRTPSARAPPPRASQPWWATVGLPCGLEAGRGVRECGLANESGRWAANDFHLPTWHAAAVSVLSRRHRTALSVGVLSHPPFLFLVLFCCSCLN